MAHALLKMRYTAACYSRVALVAVQPPSSRIRALLHLHNRLLFEWSTFPFAPQHGWISLGNQLEETQIHEPELRRRYEERYGPAASPRDGQRRTLPSYAQPSVYGP